MFTQTATELFASFFRCRDFQEKNEDRERERMKKERSKTQTTSNNTARATRFSVFSIKEINQHQILNMEITATQQHEERRKKKPLKLRWHDNGQFNINPIIQLTACSCAARCTVLLRVIHSEFRETFDRARAHTSHGATWRPNSVFARSHSTSYLNIIVFFLFLSSRLFFSFFILCSLPVSQSVCVYVSSVVDKRREIMQSIQCSVRDVNLCAQTFLTNFKFYFS